MSHNKHIPNALKKEQLQVLERLQKLLHNDFRMTAVMATEIEFYLVGAGAAAYPDALLHDISAALRNAGVDFEDVQRERGVDQYEIALKPSSDLSKIALNTSMLERIVSDVSACQSVRADFSSKPFEDQPGSGLHVHVHLEDLQGGNQFFRSEENYSKYLLFSIGGLLELLPACMPIFSPYEQSFSRFRAKNNVPITVSWGPNNRTVAIRLPTKPMDNKHIEHRVSGADADPAMVMTAILAGIHYGLKMQLYPGDPVHGDASLPMYGCEKIPTDFDTAIGLMRHSNILPAYFGDDLFTRYMQRSLYPEAF